MSIYTIKSVNQFTNNLSDYYLNLLKSWISINKYTKIPSNFRTIRQEIIWGNQQIKFKNKSHIFKLKKRYFKDLIYYVLETPRTWPTGRRYLGPLPHLTVCPFVA